MALNSIYYAPFDMVAYLTACRGKLARNGHIVFDMVDRAFDQFPWHLPERERKPTQYVVRLSPQQLTQQAASAGLQATVHDLHTKRPPRYLAILGK
jgi:hypothetical protein